MDVIKEIANWANKLPHWQSDAVRRIFTSEKLSSKDEDEIFAMLLSAHQIADEDTTPPKPLPFSTVVQVSKKSPRRVLLTELHSLNGVNALVPNQSIKFSLDGLTVIYGENGTGKSGYARVLKHACNAREKGEPILSDVTKPTKQTASAIIELSVDDERIAYKWNADCAPSIILSEIAVFDAHCARVFIDEANEVGYIPYGLDIFKKLAELCNSLKRKITQRISQIPQSLKFVDEFTPTTNIGRFILTISAMSDLNRLKILSQIDNIQLARLDGLRKIISTTKTNPPKRQASQLRQKKARFEQLFTKINTISTTLSTESLQKLINLKESSDTDVKAAEYASKILFTNEPIPSTGSDPWRILFNAAKEFSENEAYPNEEFPVTRENAVCVLCQQPLSEVAAKRLKRFKEFILNDTEEQKIKSETAFNGAFQILNKLDIKCISNDVTLIDELRDHDENLVTKVNKFCSEATKCKQDSIKYIIERTCDVIPKIDNSVGEDLKHAINLLEESAKEFDKADKPEELKRLQDELAELEDRERLGKKYDEIKEFINNKKLEKALKDCESELDTTRITRFGSELMERAVTEQLIEALQKELNLFDVQCVPLNMRKLGERGKTKLQLSIQSGDRPSNVLSEGEQGIIAIASFLAELYTCSTRSPIIFDDPVSSLDHLFRERVAKRLVYEAKLRQVIVFTHDIVMLLALEGECGEQRVPLKMHTIRRSTNGPGECPSNMERPWHTCKTKDRIGILKNESAKFNKIKSISQEDYEAAASELYGKLRETWERAIEEVLFQNVINRFRPSIETMRLKRVTIEETDYPTIDRAMKKCSKWMTGHDSAAALGSPFPSPKEIEEDINVLEQFVIEIKKRAEHAENDAETLIEPPQSKISDCRATRIVDLSDPRCERLG